LIKHGGALGFAISRDEAQRQEDEYQVMRERVTEALKRTFRPEFLNRLDGVMVFRSLSKEQIKDIVDLELNRVRVQLTEQNVTMEVEEDVKAAIAETGYDVEYGARPLRRVIQDKLEDRLSEALLSGQVKPGDRVKIVLGPNNQLDLTVVSADSDPVEDLLPELAGSMAH
jgi:ATP-dependent Clp protease ATP-binding subunit ClpC